MMPLLMMHLSQPPEPPIARNPALPGPLNDLILRLLEKEPKMRVQSCRELAQELNRIKPLLK
jgi:serine/threonine-protein kinase